MVPARWVQSALALGLARWAVTCLDLALMGWKVGRKLGWCCVVAEEMRLRNMQVQIIVLLGPTSEYKWRESFK
jgi:hypothetical protein